MVICLQYCYDTGLKTVVANAVFECNYSKCNKYIFNVNLSSGLVSKFTAELILELKFLCREKKKICVLTS